MRPSPAPVVARLRPSAAGRGRRRRHPERHGAARRRGRPRRGHRRGDVDAEPVRRPGRAPRRPSPGYRRRPRGDRRPRPLRRPRRRARRLAGAGAGARLRADALPDGAARQSRRAATGHLAAGDRSADRGGRRRWPAAPRRRCPRRERRYRSVETGAEDRLAAGAALRLDRRRRTPDAASCPRRAARASGPPARPPRGRPRPRGPAGDGEGRRRRERRRRGARTPGA